MYFKRTLRFHFGSSFLPNLKKEEEVLRNNTGARHQGYIKMPTPISKISPLTPYRYCIGGLNATMYSAVKLAES